MEAHEAPFTFMKGSLRIEIPFFQRPYVWTEENWRELLDDLLDTESSHFLGSIILKSIPTPSGEQPRWSLIDGQQRLTTLSVLLRACYDSLPLESYDEESRKLVEADLKDILSYRTKTIGGKNLLKINHSHTDESAYSAAVGGDAKDDLASIILSSEAEKGKAPSHGILQCYKYFRLELEGKRSDAESLWNLLTNENAKILVKIDLSSDENEQAIFDTVNSAGVRLTSSDTIKNSLFQKLIESSTTDGERDEVIEFYNQTWKETFACDTDAIAYWSTTRSIGRINRDNLEILLHSVALIQGIYDPEVNRMAELSQTYKRYIEAKAPSETRRLIEEICSYAATFRRFFYSFDSTTAFGFDQPVKRLFHILEVCNISTFHAYILKILNACGKMDEDEIPDESLDALRDIERIVIRHVLCRASTKNFNKDCAELLDGKITTKDLLADEAISDESLRVHLLSIYIKYARLALFWTELKRRHEDKKCTEKELKYDYSLEHVMPQKWHEHWPVTAPPVAHPDTGEAVADPGEAERLRESAVHEIGNMALLNQSLNTSLRNYDFKRKVNGDGKKKGMRQYAYLLSTQDVVEIADTNGTWNELTIRNRTLDLANQILSIW